jgi:hypothetical protein
MRSLLRTEYLSTEDLFFWGTLFATSPLGRFISYEEKSDGQGKQSEVHEQAETKG